ncbi:MAG: hypothetical protein FWE88_05670 [Phycisphaerae bacterium]|nr:hypothetical protein [Phycisphaerae bacterium]
MNTFARWSRIGTVFAVLAAACWLVGAAAQTTRPATTTRPVATPRAAEAAKPAADARVRETHPNGRLLEGFENFSALQGQGQLVTVTEGPGVTEGNAALQIPPQGAVTIRPSRRDISRPWWLRVDTLNVQPESQRLRFEFSGGISTGIVAIVAPGRDTLSMPLAMLSIITGREWDEDDRPVLTIRNLSESPIIIDNLRVEPPMDWPRDARAYDLGTRFAWPGFSNDTDRELGVWGNSTVAPNYPHPLVGSAYGPWPDFRTTARFQMQGGSKGQTVGYVWLSHVSLFNMQPLEYFAKLNGKFLVRKQNQPRQMLGTDGKTGMMIGFNGEWSPAWFDKTYAPMFYDTVPIALNPGSNELELFNTQMTAVVLAPASERGALLKAVEQVEKDLSAYRRQFVAGRRVEPTCTFAATEEEARMGMMLLPADDTAFSPTWQPTDETRLAKAEVTTFAGATAVIPLAVVPLKKGQISVFPGAFRSTEGGKALPLSRPVEMQFATRLPRLTEATIYMHPWLLRSRVAAAKEREIIPAAVVLSIAPNAAEGTYAGQIKLTGAGGSCVLPVEVTVRHIGMPSRMPTFGVSDGTAARDAYGPMSGAMEARDRDRLTGAVRQELVKAGFNAFSIPAVGLNRELAPVDDACVQALKSIGPKATGVAICDLGSAHYALGNRGYDRGLGANYVRGLGTAISRTQSLVNRAGVSDCLFHAGWIGDRNVDYILDTGEVIQHAKGRSIAWIGGYHLRGRSDNDMRRFRDCFSALLVTAGYPVHNEIASFTQGGSGPSSRDVYFEFRTPDVYMMGFYSFGMGVQGWYCVGMFMRPGAYSGWGFGSPGYLVPETDMGKFAPTVSVLRVWQGQSDFLLARRAEEVMEAARRAGVDEGELPALLGAIRDKAREPRTIGTDHIELRCGAMSPQELNDLRQKLIAATADVLKKMPKR